MKATITKKKNKQIVQMRLCGETRKNYLSYVNKRQLQTTKREWNQTAKVLALNNQSALVVSVCGESKGPWVDHTSEFFVLRGNGIEAALNRLGHTFSQLALLLSGAA